MSETPSGRVTTVLNNGVATITFFHPAQNSLPSNLLAQLTNEIEKAGTNGAVHVIVMKSEGDRTFCAGASFDELLQIKDKKTGA
jgi:methylglutaconyl-CoA hydratase